MVDRGFPVVGVGGWPGHRNGGPQILRPFTFPNFLYVETPPIYQPMT